MKRWIIRAMFFGLLLFAAPVSAASVTVDVTGGDVRSVLLAAARMGNLPLIVDDSVTGTVTAHLTGEAEEVLHLIAAARGIHLERHGDVWLAVGTEVRDAQRRVHTYVVRYADPEELAHAANLSSRVKENARSCRKIIKIRAKMRTRIPIRRSAFLWIQRRIRFSFTVRSRRLVPYARSFLPSTRRRVRCRLRRVLLPSPSGQQRSLASTGHGHRCRSTRTSHVMRQAAGTSTDAMRGWTARVPPGSYALDADPRACRMSSTTRRRSAHSSRRARQRCLPVRT